jgi:hypothetical protein
MTNEQWEQFVERAKEKFDSVTIREDDWEIQDDGMSRAKGTLDTLEFYHPDTDDHYRIIRQNTPLVLAKKMHYSHRQGDTARAEYITSDKEFSHKIVVYKEDDFGDWQEVRLDSLSM